MADAIAFCFPDRGVKVRSMSPSAELDIRHIDGRLP